MMVISFLTILNMSITATYIFLFVLILRQLLHRVPKIISYMLWSVVLFRLVCPISFTSVVSILGGLSWFNIHSSVGRSMEYIFFNNGPQINAGLSGVNNFINDTLPKTVQSPGSSSIQIWIFITACVWITGIIAMVVYGLVSYIRLKRKISSSTFLFDNVYETDAVASPFIFGVIKPRIYIPSGLSKVEQEYVLCHEKIHIMRLDYILKPFAFLVLSVHWFNPFMWLAFWLMSQDMEMSCDERVICNLDDHKKAEYSETLFNLAIKRPVIAGSPLAFGENGTKARIRNILNYKKPAFWIIVLVVIITTTAGIALLANPREITDINNNINTDNIENPDNLTDKKDEAVYSLLKLGKNGEILQNISPLSGDASKLAEDIIFDYMSKSAAWPGIDIKTLDECYVLQATYVDGTIINYFAYILKGNAVMQKGEDGYYSNIDNYLYEKLVQLRL